MYSCVLYGSQKKRRLFPYTPLTSDYSDAVCFLRGADRILKYSCKYYSPLKWLIWKLLKCPECCIASALP